MTDETLNQGKALKVKIESIETVLKYMDQPEPPIYVGRDGYNVTDRINTTIDTTIRTLIKTDLQNRIDELKKQFSEL